jgi:ABC-type Fe3+ transport system substrate-binding protein
MSEFESAGNTRTMVLAIIVIAIIGVAGVSIMLLGPGFGPGNNNTTTTTTTGTTTTTTNTGGGITLTILTRHDISIQSAYTEAFLKSPQAKAANIVDLKWRAPTEEFWDDLINQGTVDVCWGGGPTLFDQLARDNLLEPLNSSKMLTAAARVNDTIAGVDMKRYNDQSQLVWVAAAISTFGFTVNNAFLSDYSLPTPTSWTDLAQPVWAEYLPTIPTISMGNAPDTTSNTRIYEIIVQALGWQAGWTTMARMAGSAKIMGGSVETQNEVEQGNVGVAMSIDFYGYLSQARNPDCQYIVPEGQSIVNGDPIAIAKGAPHESAAEVFVDYILSAQGQAIWLDNNIRRMPVMRSAFDQVTGVDDLYAAFNRTVSTVGIDFNDTYSLSMNRALIKYFEAVFTDAHTELVNCWKAIYDAYHAGTITLGQVDTYATMMAQMITINDPKSGLPEAFTPVYAANINNDMIYDSTYASTVQARWTTNAKIQYTYVQSLVEAL